MKALPFIIILLFIIKSVWAQETDQAKEAQNPLANIISMPLHNNTSFGIDTSDRTSNTLNIQPIYPISLGKEWIMINRSIIPIQSTPDFSESSGTISGLGDISYTAWFAPPPKGSLTWGIGPSFILPTASKDILGSGKLSLGPSVVLVNMTEKIMLAAVIADWISVAGDENRADVHTFYFQYILTKFLPKKWYVSTAPINTANWEAPEGERWTIPVGGGFGKMFKIGKMPLDAQTQAFYFVEKPTGGADWQLRVQLKMIFPK